QPVQPGFLGRLAQGGIPRILPLLHRPAGYLDARIRLVRMREYEQTRARSDIGEGLADRWFWWWKRLVTLHTPNDIRRPHCLEESSYSGRTTHPGGDRTLPTRCPALRPVPRSRHRQIPTWGNPRISPAPSCTGHDPRQEKSTLAN